MTDIEEKALALLNEVRKEQGYPPAKWDSLDVEWLTIETIGRAIEQHEATKQELSDFKQEVSDALHVWYDGTYPPVLDRFIIPKPKPDPLVEIIGELNDGTWGETKAEYADRLRAALDAFGLEIREKNDD